MDKRKSDFKNHISEIVNKSSLDESTKTVLGKVFQAMADYEYELLSDLEKIVREEQQGLNFKTRKELVNNKDAEYPGSKWDKSWTIKTVLADEDDEKQYESKGLYAIDTGSGIFFAGNDIEADIQKNAQIEQNFKYRHLFLDCPYEQIESICQKSYKGVLNKSGREFSYRLSVNRRFAEKEKILFDIAAIYKIDRPVIFSPYARHAVDIMIEDADISGMEQFLADEPDFKFAENDLQEILLTDRLLMWNVQIEECRDDRYSIAANEREDSYICEAEVEDEDKAVKYILPYGTFQGICKSKENIKVYSNERLKGFRLLTINDVPDRDIQGDIFANEFDGSDFIKMERLRTKRDIEAVLNKFRMSAFSCRYMGINKTPSAKNRIVRYERDLDYCNDNNEQYYAKSRHTPICEILFSGSERLLTDYANYVLHYMEKNYPEFNWAGVHK